MCSFVVKSSHSQEDVENSAQMDDEIERIAVEQRRRRRRGKIDMLIIWKEMRRAFVRSFCLYVMFSQEIRSVVVIHLHQPGETHHSINRYGQFIIPLLRARQMTEASRLCSPPSGKQNCPFRLANGNASHRIASSGNWKNRRKETEEPVCLDPLILRRVNWTERERENNAISPFFLLTQSDKCPSTHTGRSSSDCIITLLLKQFFDDQIFFLFTSRLITWLKERETFVFVHLHAASCYLHRIFIDR